MAINFPDSPTTGQTYTVDGKSWRYTGTRWETLAAGVLPTIRTETADTDLVSSDQLNVVRFNGTSAQVLTVEDVLDVGGYVTVIQDNSGSVEFQSGTGVTLLSSTGLFTAKSQNSVVTIRCVASGQYRLSGELTPVIPFVATGGTISTSGAYTVHTFTSNGTFQVTSGESDVDILVVAGGGSGGAGTGGGGGAGGLIYLQSYPVQTSSYTVTVGAGGTNDDVGVGTSGNNTVVTNGTRTLTALGGGAGGATETGNVTFAASNGGSGGGAQNYYPSNGNTTPGSATQPSTTSDGVSSYINSGFGNNGSGGVSSAGSGGGGGGAGAAAASGSANGGAGKQYDISGTLSWYAAGGSGGSAGNTSTNGIGGYFISPSGTAAVANTGSGGGGGYNHDTGYGGNGGSGIVIVRYLTNA